MVATAHFEAEDASSPLAEMDLTAAIIIRAVSDGLTVALGTRELAPPATAGFNMWSRSTQSLREQTVPNGWTRSDRGSALTTHPEGRFSIAVTLGNHDTGRPDRNPRTRYPRGVRVQTQIDVNRALQLDLWGVPAATTVTSLVPPDTLWLLLHHRDMRKREMRFELSLPVTVDHEGRASGWVKRIFFPPISFDDLGIGDVSDAPDESGWDDSFEGEDDFPDITFKS